MSWKRTCGKLLPPQINEMNKNHLQFQGGKSTTPASAGEQKDQNIVSQIFGTTSDHDYQL